MSQFSFDSMKILNILKQHYFSVPKYQRSYSWDEEEYSDFWDDIINATNNDRDYFLGTIVLSQEATPNHAAIIDGQQRLATTTILLSSMRDVYKESDNQAVNRAAASIHNDYLAPYDSTTFQEKQRLRLNPFDNDFYYSNIISNTEVESSSSSHQKMRCAKSFFIHKLQEIKNRNPTNWQTIIAKLHAFLGEKAHVVVVRAMSDQEAFTIFETLNDRGADLTIADLLKNYLFGTSETEIDYVQLKWIEAGTILNISENNRIFIDFLRHLWSSLYGKTRERDLYRRIKETIRDHGDAVRFSNEIHAGAELYQAIISSESDFWAGKSAQTLEHARALMILDLEQNRPLLLAMMQHFSVAELDNSLRALVAWSIRGIIVGGIGGGQAEKIYCDAATAIRRGAIKDREGLLESLTRMVPHDSAFYNAIVYEKAPKTIIARYLLQIMERHLQGIKEPELVVNTDKEEINLEHILPKNATTTDWPNIPQEDVPVYANRLGNLTLLKKSENNRVGNRGWNIKKAALQKSSLKLNEKIKHETDWGKSEIEERSKRLGELAVTIWRR